jgi:hypothetical protein
LNDSEGIRVEILYPGRLNDGRGGDFRDAVITSGDTRKSGNIEIHTRTSGWQSHGHHKDPIYNQVVLHVAMEQDRPGKVKLQNGQSIPTVILGTYADQRPQSTFSPLPCQDIARKSKDPARYLDRAGERRFFSRASRYKFELDQIEAGQSLYQGVLEALGYTKNQQPFRELTRRVPLSDLEEIANAGGTETDALGRLQNLLLCNASDLNWELYKVRPDNLPALRIEALSHLLYYYRERGWLQSFVNIIRQNPLDRMRQKLESAFVVKTKDGRVLLGKDRAAEIIINVLLPFAWSWSRRNHEPNLSRKVMKIYRLYPRMESNSIERHMLQQLSLDRRQVNSARRQQGLIHLYKNRCTQGKCRRCGFNYSRSLRSFSRSLPRDSGDFPEVLAGEACSRK